jgi:hypothetical protein
MRQTKISIQPKTIGKPNKNNMRNFNHIKFNFNSKITIIVFFFLSLNQHYQPLLKCKVKIIYEIIVFNIQYKTKAATVH